MLAERGILYAPDYVINAGGLIQVCDELGRLQKERAFRKAGMIYQRLLNIFAMAKAENISTAVAADKIAEERIETISRVRRSYVGRITEVSDDPLDSGNQSRFLLPPNWRCLKTKFCIPLKPCATIPGTGSGHCRSAGVGLLWFPGGWKQTLTAMTN